MKAVEQKNNGRPYRIDRIRELVSKDIAFYPHKRSKSEAVSQCMLDICDDIIYGRLSEVDIEDSTVDWLEYVCNSPIWNNVADFEGTMNMISRDYGYGKKVVNLMDLNEYLANLYFQASRKIVKLLHKKRL